MTNRKINCHWTSGLGARPRVSCLTEPEAVSLIMRHAGQRLVLGRTIIAATSHVPEAPLVREPRCLMIHETGHRVITGCRQTRRISLTSRPTWVPVQMCRIADAEIGRASCRERV